MLEILEILEIFNSDWMPGAALPVEFLTQYGKTNFEVWKKYLNFKEFFILSKIYIFLFLFYNDYKDQENVLLK